MTFRRLSRFVIAAVALTAVGCGHAASPVSSPASLPSSTVDSTIGTDPTGLRTGIAGAFHIHADPSKGEFEITPVALRNGAAQGDLYQLAVNPFGIVAMFPPQCGPWLDLGPGYTDFYYTVRHSFAKPSNLAGPATAGNRADLGITGRVVFMLDAPSMSTDPMDPNYEGNFTFPFASGTAICDPTGVLNANGYYNPGGLMTSAFHTPANGTNFFPFKALVDETLDSRTDSTDCNIPISNSGSLQGNYTASGGWGSTSIWTGTPMGTGYGILHQGQDATNFMRIQDGYAFDTLALVVANYVDPRGGTTSQEKRANRLPQNDTSKFAYSMPGGAVDFEQVSFGNFTGPLAGTQGATVMADVTILDQKLGVAGPPEMASMELGIQTPTWPAMGGTAPYADFIGVDITYTDIPPATPGGEDTAAYVGIRSDFAATGFVLDGNLSPMASNLPVPAVVQVALVDIN